MLLITLMEQEVCKLTNDRSTLQGSLYECKDQLISELADKGVTATYAPSTGLLGLIHKISDIAPSVGGITPVVTIDISKTPSGTIYAGDTVIIECKVNADYDDESITDIDLHGYLQGATLTIKNNGTTLGTAVSDSTGIATYTISNIASGSYSITAHFDGTGTDYESATSTALTFTVQEGWTTVWNDPCLPNDNKSADYTNFGSQPTLDITNDGMKVSSSSGERWLVIPYTITSSTNFKISYYVTSFSKYASNIEISESSSNRHISIAYNNNNTWGVGGTNYNGNAPSSSDKITIERTNGLLSLKVGSTTIVDNLSNTDQGYIAFETYSGDQRWSRYKDIKLEVKS